MCEHIQAVWKDPAIIDTYERRNELQIPDNTAYFIEERLEAISKTNYRPTHQVNKNNKNNQR